MRTFSLCLHQSQIHEVTIDLTLLPGLPQLHLSGDVAKELKECHPKLKAAFLNQGLAWPRTKQIVVDIRSPLAPAGRSVELAITAALLRAMDVLNCPKEDTDFFFVGELSVEGKITSPSWLDSRDRHPSGRPVLSGPGGAGDFFIEDLGQIHSPRPSVRTNEHIEWRRPQLSGYEFSPACADVIAVAAAGEHHLLLAGPPGDGKTTLVACIHQALDDLEPSRRRELFFTHRLQGQGELSWRPLVSPHHSSSALAILGGGLPPQPGELTRAHGGILFLDEYLQFSTKVQEALREPLERHVIRVARGPKAATFPADFQLIAATNLCPCGHLRPRMPRACPMNLTRCRSHIDRLSGPMLDRFHIVSFSHTWAGPRKIPLEEIKNRVDKAIQVRLNRAQTVPNGKLQVPALISRLPKEVKAGLPPMTGSDRRKNSLIAVAQTLADLDNEGKIEFKQISQAENYVLNPFHQLTQLFA